MGVLVVCAVGLSGPAQASTVTGEDFRPEVGDEGGSYGDARVVGGPGEANAFTVRPKERGGVEVRDAGAVLQAGEGCRSVDAHAALCGAWMDGTVTLDGGDGDDVIDTRAMPVDPDPKYGGKRARALGGDGDDRLIGRMLKGAGGGPGRDTIRALSAGGEAPVSGGPGRDDIRAALSYTVQETDADGADIIDAPRLSYDYAGVDLVDLSYEDRKAPIRVDLRSGRTSEGDRLHGVREVDGGQGDDTLLGSDHAESLLGGGGADVVRGHGGADTIYGNAITRFRDGKNRLAGGAGNDTVVLSSGDTARCGPGDDLVYPPKGRVPPAGCERQGIGSYHALRAPRLVGQTVLFPISATDSSPSYEIIGVRLKGRARRLGRLRLPGSLRPRTLRLMVGFRAATGLRRGRVLLLGCERRKFEQCVATRIASAS